MNDEEINVSEGQTLAFNAGDKEISGLVISSNPGDGVNADVLVEITESISIGTPLSVPGRGGCGTADPFSKYGRTFVRFRIPIEHIELSTIGR